MPLPPPALRNLFLPERVSWGLSFLFLGESQRASPSWTIPQGNSPSPWPRGDQHLHDGHLVSLEPCRGRGEVSTGGGGLGADPTPSSTQGSSTRRLSLPCQVRGFAKPTQPPSPSVSQHRLFLGPVTAVLLHSQQQDLLLRCHGHSLPSPAREKQGQADGAQSWGFTRLFSER